MCVDGAGPRPPRGPRAKSQLSPEEKIAEYDPFVSYSGTYDIRGSRVRFYPQVSLNPSFMAGGGGEPMRSRWMGTCCGSHETATEPR